MATVTIKPSAAQGYQGSTTVNNTNYWIGRPSGYSSAFTVRYTFTTTKKLKGFVAKITGGLQGTVDGNFMYSLSTSPSFPSTWSSAAASGNTITVTYGGELAANTTYYLFVSKSTAGNYVYYAGCSASNVTITGETAGGVVRVVYGGQVKEAAPKVYKGGVWKTLSPRAYKSGAWKELS